MRQSLHDPESSDRDDFVAQRQRMVREQVELRGVSDARVLDAMRKVPRHLFVPEHLRGEAYEDYPLPIGDGQTISQPYIVGLMSELAAVGPGSKVLEIGTGSGYQAAVLAELGAHVFSIEIVAPLAERARQALRDAGYEARVQVRHGDGYLGWPSEAPFDAIVITAAPPELPLPLESQVAIGGRIVVPIGTGMQELVVLRRDEQGLSRRDIIPVRFVPMTGRALGDA